MSLSGSRCAVAFCEGPIKQQQVLRRHLDNIIFILDSSITVIKRCPLSSLASTAGHLQDTRTHNTPQHS